MTEQELIATYPNIQWRSPVGTRLLGSQDRRLACRLCIALHGLHASQIKDLPRTQEDFAKHMAFTHNLIAVFENELQPEQR